MIRTSCGPGETSTPRSLNTQCRAAGLIRSRTHVCRTSISVTRSAIPQEFGLGCRRDHDVQHRALVAQARRARRRPGDTVATRHPARRATRCQTWLHQLDDFLPSAGRGDVALTILRLPGKNPSPAMDFDTVVSGRRDAASPWVAPLSRIERCPPSSPARGPQHEARPRWSTLAVAGIK